MFKFQQFISHWMRQQPEIVVEVQRNKLSPEAFCFLCVSSLVLYCINCSFVLYAHYIKKQAKTTKRKRQQATKTNKLPRITWYHDDGIFIKASGPSCAKQTATLTVLGTRTWIKSIKFSIMKIVCCCVRVRLYVFVFCNLVLPLSAAFVASECC